MSTRLDENYEVYQLLYCSLATEQMSQSQMAQMLDNARATNKMDHITGLLMVHDGIYVQWLEGPAHAVKDLWARLQRDPRHYCVVKLLEVMEAEERTCPTWSMREVGRDELLGIVRHADAEIDTTLNPWGQAVHALHELLEQPDTHHYINERYTRQTKGV